MCVCVFLSSQLQTSKSKELFNFMLCSLSGPDTELCMLWVLRPRDHGDMEAEVEGGSGRRYPFVKERESLYF